MTPMVAVELEPSEKPEVAPARDRDSKASTHGPNTHGDCSHTKERLFPFTVALLHM